MPHREGAVGDGQVLESGEVVCGVGGDEAAALEEDEGQELVEGPEVLSGGGDDLGVLAEVGVEGGGHLVDEGLGDRAQ